jgi:plasmid stabilization system protein ParE
LNVRWSVQALRHIEEIRDFVSTGRVARSGNLRELVLGSYVLVYRMLDDVVEIVTVVHGAQRRKP